MKEGRREEADAAKAEVAKLKESQKEVADALAATEVEIREILLTIPNVPCAIVLHRGVRQKTMLWRRPEDICQNCLRMRCHTGISPRSTI